MEQREKNPLSILLQDKMGVGVGGGVMCFSWRLGYGGVGWEQTECVYIDLRIK